MNSRLLLPSVFIAASLFVSSGVFTHAELSFPRDLFVGIRGADVTELQKILNRDVNTAVALSGPGSSGQETDFFGAATRRAVIKFQEKYAATVLAPSRLSFGTGYVGARTKVKLLEVNVGDALATSATPASAAPVSTTLSVPVSPSPAPAPVAPISKEAQEKIDLKKYGNELGTKLTAYVKVTETLDLPHLMVNAVNSPDQKYIDGLQKFADQVADFSKTLSTIATPDSAVDIQKSLVSNYANQGKILQTIIDERSGVSITVESSMRYNDTVLETVKSFVKLMQFFKEKGVSFGPQDEGYFFNIPQ